METVIFFFSSSFHGYDARVSSTSSSPSYPILVLGFGSAQLSVLLTFKSMPVCCVNSMPMRYYIDTYLFLFVWIVRGIMKKRREKIALTNSVKWKFMANLIGESVYSLPHLSMLYVLYHTPHKNTYLFWSNETFRPTCCVQCVQRTMLRSTRISISLYTD